MSKARLNGKPGTFPGAPRNPGSGSMYLYRIRDTNRCESGMTDAAEAASQHGQFTLRLGKHYQQWPAINATCLRQPAQGGVWLVRLVSELPAESVNQSLLELLEQLNQGQQEAGLWKPRFQLLDPVPAQGMPTAKLSFAQQMK